MLWLDGERDMSEHNWQTKRGHDRGDDGYFAVQLCATCGARRMIVIEAGETVQLSSEPDPLRECKTGGQGDRVQYGNR